MPRTTRSASSSTVLTETGERLLTMRQVCGITSWSRTSVNRLMRQGNFPMAVKIGAQRIAFRESEVREYVASRRPRGTSAGERAHAAQPSAGF